MQQQLQVKVRLPLHFPIWTAKRTNASVILILLEMGRFDDDDDDEIDGDDDDVVGFFCLLSFCSTFFNIDKGTYFKCTADIENEDSYCFLGYMYFP